MITILKVKIDGADLDVEDVSFPLGRHLIVWHLVDEVDETASLNFKWVDEAPSIFGKFVQVGTNWGAMSDTHLTHDDDGGWRYQLSLNMDGRKYSTRARRRVGVIGNGGNPNIRND